MFLINKIVNFLYTLFLFINKTMYINIKLSKNYFYMTVIQVIHNNILNLENKSFKDISSLTKIIHKESKFLVGSNNNVSLFDAHKTSKRSSEQKYKCSYPLCLCSLIIKTETNGDGSIHVRKVIITNNHNHLLNTLPTKKNRGLLSDETKEIIKTKTKEGLPAQQIRSNYRIDCSPNVFYQCRKETLKEKCDNQIQTLIENVEKNHHWSYNILYDNSNTFYGAFFVYSYIFSFIPSNEIDVIVIDDSSFSLSFNTPIEVMIFITKTNEYIPISFGILKNRTIDEFNLYFEYVKDFFHDIKIILMDRHSSQFHSARKIFEESNIVFCAIHLERNISTNLGKKNKLSTLFWQMRKQRTIDSEEIFIKYLKKIKNSRFKLMMINSLEYFLPSKIDDFFLKIQRDFTVDNTNGIESFFHILKERLPENVVTYEDLFNVIDFTVETRLINYDYNKLYFYQRSLLLNVIGDQVTSLKNECIIKLIDYCSSNNINLNSKLSNYQIQALIQQIDKENDIRIIIPVSPKHLKTTINPQQICNFNIQDDIFSAFEKYFSDNNSIEIKSQLHEYFKYTFSLMNEEYSFDVENLNYSNLKKCLQNTFDSLRDNKQHFDHIMHNMYELLICLENSEYISSEVLYNDPPKQKNRGGRRETKLSGNATHSKKKKQKKPKNSKTNRTCSICKQKHQTEKCPLKSIKDFQQYLKRLNLNQRKKAFANSNFAEKFSLENFLTLSS